MQNQKEAVFSAVCSVLQQDSFDSAVELTREERAMVIEIVTQGFTSGTVEFSDSARTKHDTESKIKTYTNGLVSNWLRKDKRLNGNVQYQTGNPGSRAGSSDPILKNLKLFKSTLTEPEHIEAVDQEIEKRMEQLKAERVKKVDIDLSLIPAELQDLIGG
jgi:hypothetical protein